MDSAKLLEAVTMDIYVALILAPLWTYPNVLNETKSGEVIGHPKSLVHIAFQRTAQDSSHMVGKRQRQIHFK